MKDEPTPGTKVLVVGIGNAYRRDDGAGLVVAQLLKPQVRKSCVVLEHSGEGASLMELWKGFDRVIVVDAVRAGGEPGTVHRLDAALQPLAAAMFRDSTHAFSLIEAVEMSRALNQLPQTLIVYGIEGQDFATGIGLSPAAEAAARKVAQRVLAEIAAWPR